MRGCIAGKRVEGYLGCGGLAIPQGPSKGPERAQEKALWLRWAHG